jgi:hypothetical protein
MNNENFSSWPDLMPMNIDISIMPAPTMMNIGAGILNSDMGYLFYFKTQHHAIPCLYLQLCDLLRFARLARSAPLLPRAHDSECLLFSEGRRNIVPLCKVAVAR